MDVSKIVGVLNVMIVLSSVGCSVVQEGKVIEEGSTVLNSVGDVVNLDQNWTSDSQQAFYFTTQGSRILPYSWYLALEQASNETLFRADAHMEALRYLPSEKSTWNPDGLAVGFVKDVNSQNNEAWMGFNCAACHTTQINYKGRGMRIDGGPSMGDFENFNVELVKALNKTYESDAKFERFSKTVLSSGASANDKTALRDKILQLSLILDQRNNMNHSGKDQPHYGYGRLDAIGAIFNQILSNFNEMPENALESNAPVSYPFLWGTDQSDVVQWTGFAPNGPASIGALIRNGGEVLGVYGQLDIVSNKVIYNSSLKIKNLGKLESWTAELRSPMWPIEYLPRINPSLAEKGVEHYNKHCVSCHQVIEWADQGKKYKAVLTPLSEVGTDPQEIINLGKTRPAGNYFGRKEGGILGDKIPLKTTGLSPLVNSVVGALLDHPIDTLEAADIELKGSVVASKSSEGTETMGVDMGISPPSALEKHLSEFIKLHNKNQATTDSKTTSSSTEVYKARPLTGIWATAPYLHNGSVPNLAELLLPAKQRSKTFYLGSREFDPVNVGFVSMPELADTKVFKYDTQLTGNLNSGHEYGTSELNKKERMELLEYLKTL